MSVELHVFMHDSRVPNSRDWQQVIDQLGFPAALESFDVRNDSGFVPTTFNGQPTGFEFCLEPAADILSSYPGVASKVGGRDTCATFPWGGDLTECAAALSAAAALAMHTDGIYYYPDDEILYDATEAVEATRRDLDELAK